MKHAHHWQRGISACDSKAIFWKIGCMALSVALLVGLFPIGLGELRAFGESEFDAGELDVSDHMMDESGERLIVVYEGDAAEVDEPLSVEEMVSAGKAFSTGEATLSDLGVVAQEEVAPASDDFGAVTVVQLDRGIAAELAIEQIEAADEVAFVQPDYSYDFLEVDDPYAASAEDPSEYQYYLEATRTDAAWELSRTEDAVTVAVLDTGINMDHPDLEGRIDADHAFDVVAGSSLSGNSDDLDHGTLVAGVLAAQANNGLGIAGTSFNARILPVKVFDGDGECSTSSLIAAYAYLADLIDEGEAPSLKVINLSLGYYASDSSDSDRALEAAIASMRDQHGVITVCAGGNEGASRTGLCYPADFSASVAVTGLSRDGSDAQWSAANAAKDISAPAEGVLSTSADGAYRIATGTSMAAPQVSAAAALLWAADESLTPDEVEELLEGAAAPVSDMRDANGSAGALDVRSALEKLLGVEAEDLQGEDSEAFGGADAPISSAAAESEAGDSPARGEDSEADDPACSWRYQDGEKVQVSPEATTGDVGAGEILPLAAAEGVGSYATWVKSNGSNSYTWKAKPTDAGERIVIPGAKRVGIDVSAWQGTINWAKVKASGISFAIIRCGTYNRTLKAHTIDPQFVANVKGARANGIDVGAYIYSYASNVTGAQSAEAEAKNALSFLKQAGLTASNMTLPIYYDLEDSSQVGFGSAKLGQMAKKFCDTVAAQGYSVGIYANQNWWRNYLTDPVFKSPSWSRWAARYPGGNKATSSGVDGTDIWQFSDCGKVDGVSGYVDMNVDYGGASAYRKKTVENGEYMIASTLDSKMMVEVPGSSLSNNQQLALLQANGQLNQRFTLAYDKATGYYSIINSYSGKALSVSAGVAKAAQPIVQVAPSSALGQRWLIRQVRSGVYTLCSALDPDYVLDVANGSSKGGTKLQLYPSNGTAAQQFKFTRSMPFGTSCTKTISPGLYTIASAAKNNMVLDVASASPNNGANVQLYIANRTAAQRYRVSYDSKTGYYSIINDNSGKAIDVKSASAKNGTNVQQYSYNGTLAQMWVIARESDGSYRLSSALDTSYVLDLASGSTANGANVQLYTTNKTIAQKFRFDKVAMPAKSVESGEYVIQTALTENMVLDISSASKANGANVQLYSMNRTAAQRFKVTYESGSGYYIVTNSNSGKVLDVSNARAANGANVQQYASNASLAQRWIITKQNGGYQISSALNPNFVLDVHGASKQNGANIQIYQSNGTNAQRFVLEKL